MNFFLNMLPTLLTGMAVLIVGALLIKDPEKRILSSLMEGLGWAAALFVTFGTEILVIGSL